MPSFRRWRLQTSGISCSVLPPPSRRSSDALRQRDSRSAAQPYKAEKQGIGRRAFRARSQRSEEHTSELQSLMRISYAVFCLKKKNRLIQNTSLEKQEEYAIMTTKATKL